jgi:hypothetical protein
MQSAKAEFRLHPVLNLPHRPFGVHGAEEVVAINGVQASKIIDSKKYLLSALHRVPGKRTG